MQFKDVVGHNTIKQRLAEGVDNGRVSHAQLFVGPEGSGSLPLALAYAQYLNCEQPANGDSCGQCNSCNKMQRFIHPDLHFSFPIFNKHTDKSRNISESFIESWRSFLAANPYNNLDSWMNTIGAENKQAGIYVAESASIIRRLSKKAFEAPYKVMVVWMVEKMTTETANKLLKLLEEPEGNTVFLLVAEHTETMLPTILSRTQITKVPKIDRQALSNHLQKKHQLAESQSSSVARIADGNYLKAIQILNTDEEQLKIFDTFVQWMRICYGRDYEALLAFVDQMHTWGREKQKSFLQYALRMVRENFMMHTAPEYESELVYLMKNEQGFASKFNRFIGPNNIGSIAVELESALFHISRNAYSKIVFTDLSLKMLGYLRQA